MDPPPSAQGGREPMRREGDGLPPLPGRRSRWYLACEFTLLYAGVPVLLCVERHAFRMRIIPTLLAVAAGCLILLLIDPTFERRRLFDTRHLGRGVFRILRVFAPWAALVGLVFAVVERDRVLALPREQPRLWLLVMCFYPLASVYPQEIIFRTFLFHRYRPLFGDGATMIVLSGLAFGAAHLFFATWIAPLLSVLGGILFARTYARSRSTLQPVIEHGLWGDYLFTIGLGWYFYGGSIQG